MGLSSYRRYAALAVAVYVALSLITASASASAQTQAQMGNQPAPASKQKDPNKIICERIEEIGSRLTSKRVCMTAAQWQEQRRLQRESVEDVQRRQTEPSR